MLVIGSVFFGVLLIGVLAYLAWSIGMIRLHRRQSNFLDSVTHELKSPITSLKLCLQTLGRQQMPPDQVADFHRYMLEDIQRLDEMVDRVLDTARLEVARGLPEPDPVDLAEVVAECAALACDRQQRGRDVVAADLPPCRLIGRRGDLQMIFRNLLDNAVKYAGDPPRVTVSLEVDGGQVVVRVADNGPGIPAKQRRQVFSRFVRVGDELEREKPGTGLGLYIVRKLVQRNRGRVRVREGEHGLGNVLEVRLPYEPADEETA